MRFSCGPSYREKFDGWQRWHRWYAWRPVRVGPRDCRWLEFVERKGTFYCNTWNGWWTWEYREYPQP